MKGAKKNVTLNVQLAYEKWVEQEEEKNLEREVPLSTSKYRFLKEIKMSFPTFSNYDKGIGDHKVLKYAQMFKDELGLSMDELIITKK